MAHLIKCAVCGHDVASNAKACPHCGAPVGEQLAKGNLCSVCGNNVIPNATSCSHCGAPVVRQEKKPKAWPLILLAIVLFIIGAIVTPGNETAKSTPAPETSSFSDPSDSSTPDSVIDNPDLEEFSEPTPFISETSAPDLAFTLSQKNALGDAKSYLRYSGFSREGLIDQLLYEKYSEEDAIWAADNAGADWKQEALESAKSYIRSSDFSYQGLLHQLDYEGFTPEEALFGADNCEADWNQEALECAESYLRYSSFSKAELEGQLAYEGFTIDQIQYALTGVGY